MGAVGTEGSAACDFGKAFGKAFAADGANNVLKYCGLLGQLYRGFLDIEHFLGGEAVVIFKGICLGSKGAKGLKHQPERTGAFPVIKRKGLLAGHVKKQVSLSQRAS